MSVDDCKRIVTEHIPQKCSEDIEDLTCPSNSQNSILFLSYDKKGRIKGWGNVVLIIHNAKTSQKNVTLAAPELLEFLGLLAEKGINDRAIHDEMEWWFEIFTEDDRNEFKIPQAQLCTAWMYNWTRKQERALGFEVEDNSSE